MELKDVITKIIKPAYKLLPAAMNSEKATIMLLAIGLQESQLTYRWQIVDVKNPTKMGPARGLWQFESGGGVHGVLTHRSTAQYAQNICRAMNIKGYAADVYGDLHRNDILACCFARLLLWTDPKALPSTESDAWDCYIRLWRPGKPHKSTWAANYKKACEAVRNYEGN